MRNFLLALALFIPFASNAATTADQLNAVAVDVNKRTPMMVDDDTRFDKVSAEGNKVLKYSYTMINYAGAQLDKKIFSDTLQKSLTKNTCEKLTKFLNSGVSIVYHYQAKDGVFLAEIKISKKSC